MTFGDFTLDRSTDLDRVLVQMAKIVDNIFIHGIEVTQAIQYYCASAHLTDPADCQPDNAVRLVARKPAWVRVYIYAPSFPPLGDIANVTGKLEISRLGWFGRYSSVATIDPPPPGVITVHRPFYPSFPTTANVAARASLSFMMRSCELVRAQRGDINATLNFIVPAEVMCGHLRFHVVVNDPRCRKDEFTADFDVTLQQTLSVRGIMVGYNGPSTSRRPNAPNLTLAAPTIGDLQTTAAWTLLIYPVRSAAVFGNAGTITLNLPLDDAQTCGGCCTNNWVNLMADLRAQVVADGNLPGVLYYGLLATGIPVGPIVGCGGGGVGSGKVGAGTTMAHELGHACGLQHSPCGVAPYDTNYPAYEPYDPANQPKASIGEYGLDISNGNIMSPNTFKDWMSYCWPPWVSLYNYGRLINKAELNPELVCSRIFWLPPVKEYKIIKGFNPEPSPILNWREEILKEMKPVISIIGVLYAEDRIEITSVMRVETTPIIRGGKDTGLTADLVGADGRVIAAAILYRLPSKTDGGCGCDDIPEEGPPYLVQAFISNVERGEALRIRRGTTEIWSRQAPKVEPQIARFEVGLRDDRLMVAWKFEASGDTEEYWLQWSVDGRRWNALATGLRGDKASLEATGLPSGAVQIRLLAGDGFYTVQAKPVMVEIPMRAPVVSILAPGNEERLMAGGSMRLLGFVSDGSGEVVPTKLAIWLLDDKEFADGLDIFVTVPNAGEHNITLVVATEGGESRRTVHFTAVSVQEEQSKKA